MEIIMRKLRKTMSMLLALCMMGSVWGLLPVHGQAEDNGVFQIAKFNSPDDVSNYNPSVAQTWNGADVSMKWTLKDGLSRTSCFPTSSRDLSGYTYFRMRYYASGAGDDITVLATYHNRNTVANNPLFYYTFKTKDAGWQELCIPLDKFTTGSLRPVEEGGENVPPSWSEIGGITLTTNYLSSHKHTPGHNIYFDEIWFENADHIYKTSSGDIVDGDLTVIDVKSVADAEYTTGSSGATEDYLETINSRKGGNEAYIMQNVAAKTLAEQRFSLDSSESLSGYNYLNMWMYSPIATNSGILVKLQNSDGTTVATYAPSDLILNWKGWKLISILLASPKSGTYAPDSFTRIALNVNGNSSTDDRGELLPRWHTDGAYGVEKIWFSAEKPEAAVTAAPETAADTVLPEGNLMVKEFNSTAKYPDPNNINFSANTSNNRLYETNARSVEWKYNNGRKWLYLYRGDAASPLLVKDAGYKYVNFWLYSPGIKYNNGVISRLYFQMAYNNNGKEGAGASTEIAMDWQGWRLISIPLDEKCINNGIVHLRLHNTKDSGSDPANWADLNNYVDVDNIWLSTGQISAPVITNAEHSDGTFTFTFNNALAANAAEKISVYNNYKAVDANITVSGNKAVVAIAEPVENARYQIRFDKELRDIFGSDLSSSESVVYEAVTSDVLTVKNGTINGFEGMTLIEVRGALKYGQNASLEFSETDETLKAVSGMKAVFTFGECREEYTLDIPLCELGEVEYTISDGTLNADVTGICYNKKREFPILLIAAQYKGKALIGVSFEPVVLKNGAADTANVSLGLSDNGTSAKILLWDSFLSMRPLKAPLPVETNNF